MKKCILAVLLGAMIISASAFAESGIEISDAWIRSAPPNTSVMAAYLKLSNHGSHAVALESASSPDFGSVSIHRTTMHDGMMKMEHMGPVTIEPNHEVIFEPGGLHLMLNDPQHPMPKGNTSRITLKFSNGDETEVTVTVRDQGDEGMMNMEMNGMDHGDDHHHH